jgi:hypothetical protein
MNRHIGRCCLTVLILGALLALSSPTAQGQEICLSAFGGRSFYVFNLSNLTEVGRILSPISGRISGDGLAACAGLSEWPIVGSAVLSIGGNEATLAFRAFTVDALSCGATDNIAVIDLATGTGPLQLNNVRSHFGNSTTMTVIPCGTAAASLGDETTAPRSTLPAGTVDVQGNASP